MAPVQAGDDPIDLVASAGALDPVVATLRELLHRSGAVRAVAVVDTPQPAIVDVGRLEPIEVQLHERLFHMPHSIELDAQPLVLPDVEQLPRFDVDPDAGTVTGMVGGLDSIIAAVRAVAAAFGGVSVAMLQLETNTPDVLLSVSVRGDEPAVVAIGDATFER